MGIYSRSFLKTKNSNFNNILDSTGGPMNVESVNAATSLTTDQCGVIILGVVGTEQAVGTGFNVNLPAPAAGAYFKFILAAPSIANNSNAAITVTATSDGSTAANIALGHVQVNNASTNVVSGVDICTFVHNAATAGDYAECFSDGTNWFFNIVGDAAGSVTLA
jgi:hypothetical protein